MSQERAPEELSAEEIAKRIGVVRVRPPEPPPSAPSAADAYRARLIAVQRAMSQRAAKRTEPPPDDLVPVTTDDSPEPRIRLIRDSAATLVGLSAVALIVIAVWPPSPNGGVLGATAAPPSPSATATAPSPSKQSATPEPTPSLGP